MGRRCGLICVQQACCARARRELASFGALADQPCPEDLREAAEESQTPLWTSPNRGHELLNLLQYHLARSLAPRITLHGVFMEIYSIGVLITGEAGSGKSELALELLSRGHRLVADDAPEFTQIAPDVLDGTCPELLQDLLEVRGLGVLNIREMFGDTAVKRNKYLRLVVHLEQTPQQSDEAMARITGESGSRKVLDLDVPVVELPVAAVRGVLMKDGRLTPVYPGEVPMRRPASSTTR